MKMTKKRASVFGLAALTIFSVGGFGGCVYGPPEPYIDDYTETAGNDSISGNEETAGNYSVSENGTGMVSADTADLEQKAGN
ncbi:MAG: hypothetical protein K6A72_02700 [Lachnospiraceae bacterium]|nr:hypothetical protein [Lachnospiraceae bacterium]